MSTENEENNTLIYQIINDANNVLHGQAEVFNNMAPYNLNHEYYSTFLCPDMIIDQSPLTSSPNPIPDEIPSQQEHMDSIKKADISKGHQIETAEIARNLTNETGQRKDKETIAKYTKAIELDPNDAFAYIGRGNVQEDLGKHNQAIADFTKAIELDPTHAIAYNNRGNVQGKLGKHTEAIADLLKAIESKRVDG